MSIAKITGATAVAAAAGVYLRRGVVPVVIAFHVGRQSERLIANPGRYGRVFRLAYDIGRKDRHRDCR